MDPFQEYRDAEKMLYGDQNLYLSYISHRKAERDYFFMTNTRIRELKEKLNIQ